MMFTNIFAASQTKKVLLHTTSPSFRFGKLLPDAIDLESPSVFWPLWKRREEKEFSEGNDAFCRGASLARVEIIEHLSSFDQGHKIPQKCGWSD